MDALLFELLVGGLVFVVGLLLAARQGYVGLSGRPLKRLLVVVGVAAFFLGLKSYLQYAPMPEVPAGTYTGGAEHVLTPTVRGGAIDYVVVVVYFLAILAIGTWFGRKQKTTQDFFFGGQRFAWWLITFSLVASIIGSYSFVKYAAKGYTYGLSSSQSYLNDWIWLPLLVFGWLPLLYFSRVTSIPEYFGRRFGKGVRLCATVALLVYLIGYVGVNLFTMGKVLNALIGVPIPLAAVIVACVSATYVTAGGQTSVIMTDLSQGLMLFATGLLILALGAWHLGGLSELWHHLPRDARLAYANFNESADFPSVGIFWQDAMANSVMAWFLNQGMMMRFVAARSVMDARRAAIVTIGGLMLVAACIVGGGGWVARALVHAGHLPETVRADQAFYVAVDYITQSPGMFGLVLATLTAALMSTVDTLLTGVSAVVVNDVYRPFFRPQAKEKELLRTARIVAMSVALVGVLLVPVYMMFASIYEAHGAFTAATTPPLVVTLLLSVFWRRFTKAAALATLILGTLAIGVSLFVPEVVGPFSLGVPAGEPGAGLFGGFVQHKYMRALYGLVVSFGIGVVVSLFTKPTDEAQALGLVFGTAREALRRYVGKPGEEQASAPVLAEARVSERPFDDDGEARPPVTLSEALARQLGAEVGDLLYVSDARRWLGGLRSGHGIVAEVAPGEAAWVALPSGLYEVVVSRARRKERVAVQKLYG